MALSTGATVLEKDPSGQMMEDVGSQEILQNVVHSVREALAS